MSKKLPVFKRWVPNWMIKVVIFMILLPSMALFSFFTTNITATAGYYGIEPADVQYSIILFYAALAAFYPLEQRFFSYFSTRQYFMIGVFLLIITSWVSYISRSPAVFFTCRILQGIFNGGVNSICITLIFSRLSGERAREIGYSIFYGILICSMPLAMVVNSLVLDNFEYQALYKAFIFMLLPGSALLVLMMNNIRLGKKFPLFQLDFTSFIYYFLVLCFLGYLLVYAQQYNWLEDLHIWGIIGMILVLSSIFILRQLKLKRPFIHLDVLKYANFRFGALLLVVLYVCRGSLNLTTSYFSNTLGMDPIHVGVLMLTNIIGVVISLVVGSRFILMKKPIRLIWLSGFGFLLVFHIWMYFLFASQADAESFILPLIIQGMGAGALIAPIIFYLISAVPAAISNSASVIGIFFRFIGFSLSMALINFFQLSSKSFHYHSLQGQVTTLNLSSSERLSMYEKLLQGRGLSADDASHAATVLLNKAVNTQAQLRYAMDYYMIISWVIIFVMLLIALFPFINKTAINLRSKQPAPASY